MLAAFMTCKFGMELWRNSEKFDDYTVNFLHPPVSSGSSVYYYPSNKDSRAVPGHHILTVMSCPTLRGGSRIQYNFSTRRN